MTRLLAIAILPLALACADEPEPIECVVDWYTLDGDFIDRTTIEAPTTDKYEAGSLCVRIDPTIGPDFPYDGDHQGCWLWAWEDGSLPELTPHHCECDCLQE